MQRRFIGRPAILAAAAAAIVLSACASAPARFYTLAPDGAHADIAGAALMADAATAPRFIEMGAVSVPERLARPQLVVRSDATRVDILEQDRWSSPFNDELRDALASGVASRLGAIDVTRGGRPAQAPVYRITVDLRELDAVRGGQVQAQFGWTITRSDNALSTVCRLRLTEAAGSGSIDGVVQGIQQVVAHAADAVSAGVAGLANGNTGICRH